MSEEISVGRIYKRLLSYVWPHKAAFFVAILGYVMFASAAPMMAHLMGWVSETLDAPTHENILVLVFSLLGIFFYRGIGTFLGKFFIAVVGRNVVHSLRTQLFNKMTRLPSSYFDGESSGRLISRVIFDVDQVTGASTRALTTSIQEGVTVIGLMLYLLWLDWTLTLIFVALVPIIVVVVAFASRFFRRYSRRIQKAMGNVTQVTNESISGYREVRTFGGRDYEQQRFYKASEYNRKQSLKFGLTEAINVPLTQQIVALGLGVMVYLMFQRLLHGHMDRDQFWQFMTAASLIAKPLRSLTDINAVVQKGVTAAASVFSVLDAESEPDTGSKTLQRAHGDVKFDQVRFRYPGAEHDALKGISLDIKAGTSVAFVGKSGSGKTTLVNLIPRFYELTSGGIAIDGTDVRELTLDSLRDQIAIVSQQVTLFNGTIKDNIAYGALGNKSDDEIMAAAKAAHADEFISQLSDGYDTMVGEDGVLLSGGQRQRIAIARAILKNAPILILDEATSALDTASERHIQAAMEEVMKGRTTFVIAHRLSTIENADRIVVIDQGEVREDGGHADLIALNGIYAQLHQIQFSE
ncbi:MAG: lipid A export permease/ATP-binding protein MsbA [Oceanospirillaceae bacterium]|uniref:lipid A export permease/ATP-binding protein MsbA n=1 Tax=unclassified Thalassolituus TaxID=2624967 RepID=UPI000C361913|nr:MULTISPECIES: lipid A export permease/ATP-binding protein MsbA [unclassified Thalassolituus]MBL35470.1 lipid A export permease/ATP-binding protein MsbA [Oceanospirillaceae bacterium]MBS53482.1 lipid A export permease/ATP-binding protein MsbA [Oceanospirillaceae bacterium]|tara:strand:+ start:3064 stop:4803 length:1740 start_codon:yes stop_codon:yes gene_type:complete